VRSVNSINLPPIPNVEQVVAGFAFALAIAAGSLALRMLTLKGAGAQFFLGWLLFALGAWQWTVPILVFFLTASALTKYALRKRGGEERTIASHDIRNAWQVLANGGMAGLLAVLWYCTGSELLYMAYLGGVASVAADTWGTEIGITSRSAPRLITTWNSVDPGRSGAISLRGMTAGAIGSAVVSASSIPWLAGETVGIALTSLVLGGTLGSVVDSYLGAAVQAQHVCSCCGRVTDQVNHCGHPTRLFRGVSWIGNDLVNLACSVTGSAAAVVLFLLFSTQ
jgi:uncharacterized protein (TIGR00297 family)